MINSQTASGYNDVRVGQINWKHYNTIKKKAMEQEFSWTGLLLSLSIAFFIVVSSAYVLSSLYSIVEVSGISVQLFEAGNLNFELLISENFEITSNNKVV